MTAEWNDLRVFLTLARAGNLTAAARQLGVSHPTVARRIKSLERALGTRLFDQLPDRFVLTGAGEELLADAEAMDAAAEAIHRRSVGLGDSATRGTIRLWAGEAMTAFLARRLSHLRDRLPGLEIELVERHYLPDLSRREADLLIHWQRLADLASIVTRRLCKVAYAVYGSKLLKVLPTSRAELREMPWCGFNELHSYMPGQSWIANLLGPGGRPIVRVNNWLILHDLVATGTGLSILPCYLGDTDPRLRRIGAVLKDVAVDQWLFVHRDLRGVPRVRAVTDAVVELFQDERATIEGTLLDENTVPPFDDAEDRHDPTTVRPKRWLSRRPQSVSRAGSRCPRALAGSSTGVD